MKPKVRIKVWHSRQWQVFPGQDLILLLNSVRDVEPLINFGTQMVAQTWGPLKRMVSEPCVSVLLLRREKSFLRLYWLSCSQKISHESRIQAIIDFVHFVHEKLSRTAKQFTLLSLSLQSLLIIGYFLDINMSNGAVFFMEFNSSTHSSQQILVILYFSHLFLYVVRR